MAESLKDQVISAAVAHIAEYGPDSLSFRRIAAAAGVSHQAPYHHFRDREGVFSEIALIGFTQFVTDVGAPPRAGDDPDVCVRLLERYVEFALTHKGYFRVMFRSDLCNIHESPEVQKVADKAFDTLLDAVTELVDSDASIEEMRLLATTMWSVAHGLATLLIDGPLESKMGAVADRRSLARAVARQTVNGLSNLH
jgi:AcrR family transcriptional regulator